MNVGMAVQTGTAKHPIFARGGRSLKGLELRIGCPRVLGPVMAGLAELGNLAEEKFGMVAAVGGMAA
jgi:hypothetical protein